MQGERGFLAGIAAKFGKGAKEAAAGLGLMAAVHGNDAGAQEKMPKKDTSGEMRPVAFKQTIQGDEIQIEGRSPARQTADELAKAKADFLLKNQNPVLNVKKD